MIVSHRNIKLVLSLVLVSGVLSAQGTRSAVSGTITDEEGSPVGGAQVVVRHLETGRTWSLLTGSEGVYTAPGLPPGSYVIEASSVGFKTALTGVRFESPREVVLDLTLKPQKSLDREPAPVSSRESKPRARGDSPTSRVTREDVSRTSGNHRLPSPAEFPPVDRRSSASPLSEPPVTRPAQPAVEPPSVDPESFSSPPTEPPPPVQALPATVQTGGFAVQMAAFRKPQPAEEFRAMLQDRGYAAHVAEVDIPGSGRSYRVRVGPFGSQEDVEEVVADMQNRLPKPLPDFWIIPSDR